MKIFFSAYKKFINYFQEVYVVKCPNKYCPLECDLIQYNLTVSSLCCNNIEDFYSLSNPPLASNKEQIGIK